MSHIFGTDIDLNNNEAKKFRAENLLSLPSVGPSDSGRIIHHTGLGKFYGWDGSLWIDLGLSLSYTLPTATTGVLGGVKIDGTTITINGSGVISGSPEYNLPTASGSVLGGVKVDNSTIFINGSGVISSPNVLGTGLELISEGGNSGWRFIGRNTGLYGDIGEQAVDLSYNSSTSSTRGATGDRSFCAGPFNTSSGLNSAVIGGVVNIASGTGSGIVGGVNGLAQGEVSFIGSGNSLIARSNGESAFGLYNIDYVPVSTIAVAAADRIFSVGNGTGTTTRKDAFTIYYAGEVKAPSLTTALVDSESTGKVLITKEWCQKGYTVATLPSGVTGRRTYVTDSTVVSLGNFGVIVSGGGTNTVPVFYDGINWIIG